MIMIEFKPMTILFPEKLAIIEKLIDRDFKLSFTNGCFDILHSGHIQSFIFAKSKSDKLIVALNSDASIKRLKGDSKPVLPLEHRLNTICALEIVDFAIYFDDDTPYDLINKIKPEIIVKGSDYNYNDVVGKDIVNDIYLAPFYEGASSSKFLSDYVNKLTSNM